MRDFSRPILYGTFLFCVGGLFWATSIDKHDEWAAPFRQNLPTVLMLTLPCIAFRDSQLAQRRSPEEK
jgi:hypothetical protein